MSATATATPSPGAGTRGVSLGSVLRSEWLKLVTVRSTFWTTLIALLLAAAVATLLSLTFSRGEDTRGRLDASITLLGSTASLSFVALVVGVLGVLSIGGEYGTLQIRSSYTAVPRRWPALVAKGIVVGAWSFAIGLVITFGGFGILAIGFGARGYEVSMGGGVAGGLVGGAAYLAIVAVFAVGLGALVRASAAGITILTAVLFVLPIILGLIGGLLRARWADDAARFLLSAAGGDLFAAPGAAGADLWAAVVALVAWIAAVWIPALLLTRFRDV